MEVMIIRIKSKMRSYDNIKYFKYVFLKLIQKDKVGSVRSFKTEINEFNEVVDYVIEVVLNYTSFNIIKELIERIKMIDLPSHSLIEIKDVKIEIGTLEEVVVTSNDLGQTLNIKKIKDILQDDLRYFSMYKENNSVIYYLYGNNINTKIQKLIK
ncbi:hypothetical protein [Anaerorhabdus sp.]|uniref:hypothetical protein n=1 Tax=Anaerorhabdus sp. TaxID=1872524 RepID=UPI002FC5D736